MQFQKLVKTSSLTCAASKLGFLNTKRLVSRTQVASIDMKIDREQKLTWVNAARTRESKGLSLIGEYAINSARWRGVPSAGIKLP